MCQVIKIKTLRIDWTSYNNGRESGTFTSFYITHTHNFSISFSILHSERSRVASLLGVIVYEPSTIEFQIACYIRWFNFVHELFKEHKEGSRAWRDDRATANIRNRSQLHSCLTWNIEGASFKFRSELCCTHQDWRSRQILPMKLGTCSTIHCVRNWKTFHFRFL